MLTHRAATRGTSADSEWTQLATRIPKILHRRIRVFCVETNASLMDFVIAAIRDPNDAWMTAADFRSFIDAQQAAGTAYQDQQLWTRMSILNSAKSGWFSTDRTMREYNRDIWHLEEVTAGDS